MSTLSCTEGVGDKGVPLNTEEYVENVQVTYPLGRGVYRIARNIGGKLSLVVWRLTLRPPT